MSQTIVHRRGMTPRKRVDYRKMRLSESIFDDLVMHEWLDNMGLAIDRRIGRSGVDPKDATPNFTSRGENRVLGTPLFGFTPEMLRILHRYKMDALGGQTITDDQLRSYIEDVLIEELDRYSVRLVLGTDEYLGYVIILPVD